MVRDTSSGRLVPAAAGPVATLYACGITPYDATHIGHAATYIALDLLVRAWRDAGHQVSYAQNVTDVDDPLLERAARDGEDWRELADREIALYRSDMEALRVLPPAHYVGAVEALGVIERFNRLLADLGTLYELDGDVYFARSADPAFGAVARLDPQTMLALAAERGGDPARPGRRIRLTRWSGWPPGPASPPGIRTSAAASRLARGVRGDRDRVPGRLVRHPGRRHRPGLPAPRDERVARPGGARRCGRLVRAGVRPVLCARRDGAAGRREDVQVPRQPGVRVRAAGGGR